MKTRAKWINNGNINKNLGTSTKTQHKNHEHPLNINEDHGDPWKTREKSMKTMEKLMNAIDKSVKTIEHINKSRGK